MATDDHATGDQKQRRRGKAPVITLEATEVATPGATEVTESTRVADPIEQIADADPPATGTPDQPADILEGASADAAVTAGDTSAAASSDPDAAASEAPAPEASTTDVTESPAPAPHSSSPEERPVAQTAPAEAPSGGFGRLVAAGLIGAVLTGGLMVGAQVAGIVPAANPPASPDLQARLAALDQAVKEVAARPLASAGSPAPVPDLAPLRQQMEASLGTLERRVKALEDRPAPVAVAPASGDAPAPSVDLGPLARDIEALKTAVAALDQPRPAAPAPTPDPGLIDERIRAAVQPQAERIGVLDGRLQASHDDLKSLGESLQALGVKIAALEATRSQGNALGQKAALVVGLQLLASAVDRGLPYAAELAAARSLGAEAAALQPLEAGAAAGLVTRAALATRFASLAPSIQRSSTPPPEGGLIDRLAAGAQSLVRVRPVGETTGDDAGAIVARVQVRLARGDLAGALTEIDKLPAASKAIARDWIGDAQARLAADTAVQRSTIQALGALGTR